MGKFKISSEEINLQAIHNRLLSRLHLKDKAKQDNIIAEQIEQVLYYLKNKKLQNDTQPSNDFIAAIQRQADEIIESSIGMINAENSLHLRSNKLFNRAHGQFVNKTSGDDIFEDELAAVIATIEGKATNTTTISLSNKLTGSDPLNIAVQDIQKEVLDLYPEFLQNKFNAQIKNREFTGIVARSGKGDVQGTSLTFNGQLVPEWEQLFRLFQGHSFSVKNYSSYSKSLYIDLGGTEYIKSILGSLSALGYNERSSQRIFYKAMYSGNSEVAQHFYHLQFGYELMGLGLGRRVDGDFEEAQKVDFFIYNDPSSDLIRVRSTAQMLLDVIESTDQQTKYLKQVTIAKSIF